MANEWNNFFDALAGGGENLAAGFLRGETRRDAANTYKKALKNIDAIISQSPTGQETQQQDAMTQFFSGFDANRPLEENIANMQPSQVGMNDGTVKPRVQSGVMPGENDLLQSFLNSYAELGTYGEFGKPYQEPLSMYYQSKQPKQQKTYRDVVNGYLVISDEEGNVLRRTKVGEEKEKDFKIGSDWQIRDNGDGTYSWYEPTAEGWVKTKLEASQRDFDEQEKLGDFGKTPRGPGRGPGGPKFNFEDKTMQSLGQDLYKLRKEIEGMGWEEASGNFDKDGKSLIDKHDELIEQLKGYGVNDWVSFSESMGKGDKVTDAKQDQQQFNDDYHEIVFGKGSVYDMLIALWQADSSTAEGAEFIQAKADELYDWLGSNIYQKVDYPLEKAIYDYVNSEINKLWNSKFGGK